MTHHCDHHHDVEKSKNLSLAFWLNLIFAVIEIVGAVLTNSVAILADALHDLGDAFSLGIAWYFAKLSQKGSTQTFSYGFKRLSLLSALLNGVILIAGSAVVLWKAVPRIFDPQPVHAPGMIGLAILGIIVNGVAVLRLKSGRTLNEKVVMWHLLEDVLGWVAVLIAAVAMLFYDVPILDPLLSVLIAFYILWNAVKSFKQVIVLLLQGVPEPLIVASLEKEILQVEGVIDLHDVHIWSLDGESHIMTAHLVVAPEVTQAQACVIKERAKALLKKYNISHSTLEVEAKDGRCVL